MYDFNWAVIIAHLMVGLIGGGAIALCLTCRRFNLAVTMIFVLGGMFWLSILGAGTLIEMLALHTCSYPLTAVVLLAGMVVGLALGQFLIQLIANVARNLKSTSLAT